MDRKYVQMALEILKKAMFKKLKKIESYQIEEVGYFDWHKESAGNQTALTAGIGSWDAHYQLNFTIDQKDYVVSDPARSLCLQVTTSDEDMWDTSNPQFIVLINGRVTRALDMNHNYVLLPQDQHNVNVALNVYTNTTQPDVFIESWLTERQNDVYRLYYTLKALYESTAVINQHNTEIWKLDEILTQVMKHIDWTHITSERFTTQVKESLVHIDDWLEKRENHQQVIEHVVGHTHIDISWFWTLKQTREKVVRSFSNAIYLMQQYPEMTFMSSSPLLYELLEIEEPAIFEQVKAYISEGRWQVEGGMYIESDVNLPSGESLIRQIMFGKRYFKHKFNKDSHILWLPDCFGFSASLPQIMKKSGLDYFFTSKMNWNETNKLPNDTFYWQGIDGSSILTQFLTTSDYSENMESGTTYNGRLNASQVKGTWARYQNKNLSRNILQIYGFGDGGGGPTEEMLEYARVFSKPLIDMPIVEHSTPLKYFQSLESDLSQNENIPRWDGELYLETHRGVMTTDALLKKRNRETEALLIQAEFISAMLHSMKHPLVDYPKESLDMAWKQVLINQFHDILPGTSASEVHKEAIARYHEAQSICHTIIDNGLKALGWKQLPPLRSPEDALLVLNATSFERDVVISDPEHDYYLPAIPPFGYQIFETSHHASKRGLDNDAGFTHITDREGSIYLENEHHRLVLNEQGEIDHFFVKILNKDLVELGNPFNQLLLYSDLPEEFDAWNVDEHSLQIPKKVTSNAIFTISSNSAYKTEILITKAFHNSSMTQKMILYKHTSRIDFETTINWQEKHVMAKVTFPTAIISGKGTYDIQFGNIERNTHSNTSWDKAQFEVCGHKWIDLSEQGYGLSLLNNGKYGHNINQSEMFITLLRSSDYPAKDIDKGIHQVTYSIFAHEGTFRGGEVYKEAYDLNNPVIVATQPQISLSDQFPKQFMSIPDKNIICETIKKAEDSNALVVRFYESEGRSTQTTINIASHYQSWVETNLMEDILDLTDVHFDGLSLEFTPYEIKTILINL